MKILVDIGHPAHVHYFKNFVKVMKNRGHKMLITARKKDITYELLNLYGLEYVPCGINVKSLSRKALNLARIDFCMLKKAFEFKPDIFLSMTSPPTAHVGRIMGKIVIGLEDTEHEKLIQNLFNPFADNILTPSCFMKDLGSKQIRFNGYLELLYLHPNWFKPDPSVLDELGVSKDDKYVIIRFVAWNASHDIGQQGLSYEGKKKLIKEIEKYAIPMISSEVPLPREFEKYRIHVLPHKMHDALYYASMYVGEGGTMASEAAVLGVPSIYTNTLRMGYTNEEEKYGILFQFEDDKNIEKIIYTVQIIFEKNKSYWKSIKEKIIKDKIDVTSFLVWFIENYPESAEIMRENPQYQDKFKYATYM